MDMSETSQPGTAGGGATLDSALDRLVNRFRSGPLPAAPDQIFTAVSERDIDLLLLEEIWSSAYFREWLLKSLGFPAERQLGLIGAWHSLSADTGESDLVVLVTDEQGHRCALMIEDKIYAAPQPRQSERYRERGTNGMAKGYWDSYLTCMTAGDTYLATTAEAKNYDRQLSHEAIRSWFQAQAETSERARYKVAVLTAAIEKSRRGYMKLELPEATRFLSGYWRIARDEFPDLGMSEPPPAGPRSQWVFFRSPAPGLQLLHKLSKGWVDLVVQGGAARLEALKAANTDVLSRKVALQAVGKSAVFRVAVREIDNRQPSALQEDRIREGLRAAMTLLELSHTISLPRDGEANTLAA